MPWVRIDDRFSEHPKWADAESAEVHWFVFALCYCNRNMTDGFIPSGAARRLLGEVPAPLKALARRGAIKPADRKGIGGYVIDGFLEYQPSKEAVLHEREKGAERLRRWRERNAKNNGVTQAFRNAVSNAVSNANPDPDPDPGTETCTQYYARARETPSDGRADWLWQTWRRAAERNTNGGALRLPVNPRDCDLSKIKEALELVSNDAVLGDAIERFHALAGEQAAALNIRAKTIGYFVMALPRLLEPEANTITEREFQAAKKHRTKIGGCHHEPPHRDDWRECVRAIALSMRGAHV